MRAELVYVAAAANRYSQVASVSSDGSLVAYGSSKFIALWDLKDDRGVIDTIPGHPGIITCVQFLQNSNDSLLSADDQGWLYLHRKEEGVWRAISKVKAHQHSVSTLVEFNGITVTGSSDATLKVWEASTVEPSASEEVQENTAHSVPKNVLKDVQLIHTGKRLPLCAAIAILPGSSAHMLAVGSTDRFVRIYVRSQQQFSEALTLSGHEDWVKSLAFNSEPSDDCQSLTLATGSQDGTIRLWNIVPVVSMDRVKELEVSESGELGDELLDAFEASLGEIAGDDGGRQISLKQHLIKVKDGIETNNFTLTFDALMIGHDSGVTSVAWNPSATPPVLLSTSVDSSVILWSPTSIGVETDDSSKLWTNHHRFGDVGGQRLGGFVGGAWLSSRELYAWGWNGVFRRWGNLEAEGDELQAITGHAAGVHGVNWNTLGDYFITASLDQTVRLHASNPLSASRWSEFARTQIHGYDCLKAVFISDFRYASISDEKTTRIFDAPGGFVSLITKLGVKAIDDTDLHRPVAASVPPLGLSNKASSSKDVYPAERDYSRPPFEAELAATTLWPEIEKIYGHGYESITLTVSNSKTLIATACKSTSAEHAVVRLFDTERFKPFGHPLEGHNLTVTDIAFNRDDSLILTVSKDRTWRLFQRQEDESGFPPIAIDKSHSRIIWDCAWMHEEDIFATASRDKTVKVWNAKAQVNQAKPLLATIKLAQAATAVDFRRKDENNRVLMAVGLENGEIMVFAGQSSSFDQWILLLKLPLSMSHVDHVYGVAWRPSEDISLATCSDDGSVRLIKFVE